MKNVDTLHVSREDHGKKPAYGFVTEGTLVPWNNKDLWIDIA